MLVMKKKRKAGTCGMCDGEMEVVLKRVCGGSTEIVYKACRECGRSFHPAGPVEDLKKKYGF